jgi:hypothetical protein
MPIDPEREACLAMAFEMARTGTFKDHSEVEQALSLGEAGVWHECLTEPEVQHHIDKLCSDAIQSRDSASTRH